MTPTAFPAAAHARRTFVLGLLGFGACAMAGMPPAPSPHRVRLLGWTLREDMPARATGLFEGPLPLGEKPLTPPDVLQEFERITLEFLPSRTPGSQGSAGIKPPVQVDWRLTTHLTIGRDDGQLLVLSEWKQGHTPWLPMKQHTERAFQWEPHQVPAQLPFPAYTAKELRSAVLRADADDWLNTLPSAKPRNPSAFLAIRAAQLQMRVSASASQHSGSPPANILTLNLPLGC